MRWSGWVGGCGGNQDCRLRLANMTWVRGCKGRVWKGDWRAGTWKDVKNMWAVNAAQFEESSNMFRTKTF